MAEKVNRMTETSLDKAGRVLMSRVRDEAISDWDMILEGKMKDARSQRLADRFSRLTGEAKAFVYELVPQVVDTTLHHLLWTFEQDDALELHVQLAAGGTANVADESDGLSGDLYDWLPRFSRQRFQNPADAE